jgi:hypothetical protein
VLFAQADDGLGGGSGLLGGLGDATQEEAHPALPPAVLPYGAEAIVVLGPVALQVVAYVEERSVQDARVDELEGDEEPAHAPVAVQKRVDGLELGMHEAAVDEHGQVALFVQEILKVVERLGHLGDRRRDEGGPGEGRPARADPVLAPSELAGELVGATGAAQELGVYLADQAQRQRQGRQPLQTVVHGPDVVHDLLHVLRHVPTSTAP